jgi:hypothetical protein
MTEKSMDDDADLERTLAEMAREGRLVEYVTDLLVRADFPENTIGGATIALKPVGGPINDKSCYKKCLKEDVRTPGSYAQCIKKCRPASTIEVFALG